MRIWKGLLREGAVLRKREVKGLIERRLREEHGGRKELEGKIN